MKIRTRLSLNVLVQVVLLLVATLSFAYVLQCQRQLDDSHHFQREAEQLVWDLQHSSDELTLMARLYVVTGKSRYAGNADTIKRMRNGLIERPRDYDSVFWDLQLADPSTIKGTQPSQPFDVRVQALGFTETERRWLTQSYQRSEALITIENRAMQLVATPTQAAGAEVAGEALARWRQALDLLHGEAYQTAKADIMAPLRAVRQSLSERLGAERRQERSRLSLATYIAWAALALLALDVVLMALSLDRAIRHPLQMLGRWAEGVKQGRMGLRTHMRDHSEFGELGEAIDGMADSVQQHLNELHEEVTRRTLAEQTVEHLANHDVLTGLPSLRLVHDRLERALIQAQRHHQGMAVLFLDLNDFKPVNDLYGHEAGDQVLKIVAQRLAMGLREADTVGRIGGDEFLILLPDVSHIDDACSVADKLAAAVAEPIFISMQTISVQVSAAIGVAVFPDAAKDVQGLIRAADRDMYQRKARMKAQRAGKGNPP